VKVDDYWMSFGRGKVCLIYLAGLRSRLGRPEYNKASQAKAGRYSSVLRRQIGEEQKEAKNAIGHSQIRFHISRTSIV
jgi:hypothetical protein